MDFSLSDIRREVWEDRGAHSIIDFSISKRMFGQLYKMIFTEIPRPHFIEYNVCLNISTKRRDAGKNEEDRVSTGENPFVSALFAMKAFNALEERVLMHNNYRMSKKNPVKIRIFATDERRFNAYKAFLSKKGYVEKPVCKRQGYVYDKFLEKVFISYEPGKTNNL